MRPLLWSGTPAWGGGGMGDFPAPLTQVFPGVTSLLAGSTGNFQVPQPRPCARSWVHSFAVPIFPSPSWVPVCPL